MTEEIIFTANTNDWKAVKKFKIDEKVPPIDVASFLASVSISFDTKIFQYLKKATNTKTLDEYIDNITKGTFKTEEDIAKVLKAINSMASTKAINACISETLSPKEKDLLKSFLKAYLTKATLAKINFCVDYTNLPLKINK
jgi:hypothetical protein